MMAPPIGICGKHKLGMAALFFVLFSPLVASQSTSSASCVASPVSVPITNFAVANQRNGALARGISVGIGSPPQNIAFMPGWNNNTFVYDKTNLCHASWADYPDQSCITARGGAYDVVSSTTHDQGDGAAFASDSSQDLPQLTQYSDQFILNSHVQLSNYNFGVAQNNSGEQMYYPMATLGLGRNSTFLRGLKEQGLISSLSWSFFWGLEGRNTPLNGSIVFGGYDEAKLHGTNYTRKLNYTRCKSGMDVTVSGISLKFLDGSKYPMLESSLPACIDPTSIGVGDMPYQGSFENFVSMTNWTSFVTNTLGNTTVRSLGLNYYDLKYLNGDSPFEGNLLVTIEDGPPPIEVSNSELVVPHVDMDLNTGAWTESQTESDLLINEIPYITNMNLNRNFLSFMYIMVNLDAGEWTMWTADNTGRAEQLVAVDETNQVVRSNFCSPSKWSSSPSSSPSDSDSKKLSTGSIIGIAIGVAAAVVLIATVAFFLLRSRRNKKTQADPAQTTAAEVAVAPGEEEPKTYNSVSNTNTMYSDQASTMHQQPYADSSHMSGQSYELPGALAQWPTELDGSSGHR
ncbi:uncharacterized protein BCR38DRAFT_418942 [Pseudomassariella vexata]|uniref:Peptidase A1 domain-containing protein n=1 Tax=Pseudomassariella vexata TaxID=1141098 RepID=A0A1Y2EKP2_9PEZI|nr:uncharacterized protein BCR38DRAFT_418942 [Pseudomassariella vexata]ORY72113.1 hypothetical protein BCR38DRAFT_418942 [Pseudomassariella vexata]